MANTPSAHKRIRQTATRTERNRVLSSRIKTLRKKTLAFAAEGKKDEAAEAYKTFSSAVDRAAKVNLLHKNNAANQKSKVNTAVKKALA